MLELFNSAGLPTNRTSLALPVWWGGRVYLLGADDLAPFCNAVNWGFEPRQKMYVQEARSLVRDVRRTDCSVDEPAGDGPPLLPPSLAGWILRRPLVGRLAEPLTGGRWRADVGSRSGVFPGMQVRIFDGSAEAPTLLVEDVAADTCRVTWMGPGAQFPNLGAVLWCEARGAALGR